MTKTPEILEFHNPSQVSLKTLGSGFRFLYKHELDGRYKGKAQFLGGSPHYPMWTVSNVGDFAQNTYRIPEDVGECYPHNPHNLTDEQVGVQYQFRLLYHHELDGRFAKTCQIYMGCDPSGKNTIWSNISGAKNLNSTYRIKKDVAYNQQNMQYVVHNPNQVDHKTLTPGYRFLFEHELDGRFQGIQEVYMVGTQNWAPSPYSATINQSRTYRVNHRLANYTMCKHNELEDSRKARKILYRVWVMEDGNAMTLDEKKWTDSIQEAGETPAITLLKIAKLYDSFKDSLVGVAGLSDWLKGELSNSDIIIKYAAETLRMSARDDFQLTPYEQEWTLKICKARNIETKDIFACPQKTVEALSKIAGWYTDYCKLASFDLPTMKKFVNSLHQITWWEKFSKLANPVHRSDCGDSCQNHAKTTTALSTTTKTTTTTTTVDWKAKEISKREELLKVAKEAMAKLPAK